MSLTLRIEEFVKFHVQARIHPGDSAIAFNVSPSKGGALFPSVPSGLLVHFKTVVEKGVNVLSISTSYDRDEKREEDSSSDAGLRDNSSSSWTTPTFSENQALIDVNLIDILSGMAPPLPSYEQTLQERQALIDLAVLPSMFNPLLPSYEQTIQESVYPSGHNSMAPLEDPVSQLRDSRDHHSTFIPHWYQIEPTMDASLVDMLSGMLSPPTFSSGTGILSGGVSEVSHAENQFEDFHVQSSFGGHDFGQSMFSQHTEDEATSPSSAPSCSSPSPSVESATPNTTSPPQSPVNTPSPGSTSSRKVKPRVPCLRADCDRHFKNDYTRSLHMKSHNIKHPRLFPCRWCSLVLSRDHDRMRHEVTKHNMKPQYRCNICRKSFSREKNLNKHKCSASR
ncbi:hypothetical protein DFH06DRAFT_1127419 [Mycena polygramma]|nr:hypothetical protein DFH06DRAFT_1127419 [Mycena polygramma]